MRELVNALEEVNSITERRPTIVVIGSGAGGTAIAEMLQGLQCSATVIVLERGPLALTTHIETQLSTNDETDGQRLSYERRRRSIEAFFEEPWEGDYSGVKTGWLVGGRVVFGGPNRSRMYPDDLNRDKWPLSTVDLHPYYVEAERRLGVRLARGSGYAQTFFFNELQRFAAFPPPVEWETSRTPTRPSAASISRLIRALLDDCQRDERRLLVVPETCAVGLAVERDVVTGVRCRSTWRPTAPERVLRADAVVLAAGSIESARLVLTSGLGHDLPAAGRYLAEHAYVRGVMEAPYHESVAAPEWVNLRVAPRSPEAIDRFEVEVRGTVKHGRARLRVTGCAALDPHRENRVTLSAQADEFGVPTAHVKLRHGHLDRARVEHMLLTMHEISARLGARWIEPPAEFPPGRSHHDAGTNRMGTDRATSVTDDHGRVHGLRNLRVADASLFPGVGCVGPVLTITALAYRVARSIHADIAGAAPKEARGPSEIIRCLRIQ
jgi:choline dehydrogenase-like flavoprotein